MCTYILFHDPASAQPLVMFSTREDYSERATTPAFLWDHDDCFLPYLQNHRLKLQFIEDAGLKPYLNAGIIAPQDQVFGGSFAGINKFGVVAALNNRENLVDCADKYSRGGLVLDALTFSSARQAAEKLYKALCRTQGEDSKKYSVFNLIIADAAETYVIMNAKPGDIDLRHNGMACHTDVGLFSLALVKVPPRQIAFIAGYDVNDLLRSKRSDKFLPVFAQLQLPHLTNTDSWCGWLAQMVHQPIPGRPGDPMDFADSRNPFNYSIAQPDPRDPIAQGFGDPHWVTISTGAYFITHRNEKSEAYLYQIAEAPRLGALSFCGYHAKTKKSEVLVHL